MLEFPAKLVTVFVPVVVLIVFFLLVLAVAKRYKKVGPNQVMVISGRKHKGDGGLMIDLSAMKGVHVDAGARRARAQGGATWGDYNREKQVYGLASTGGEVSSTGVAGLTLGGGLGYLMGQQGMTV